MYKAYELDFTNADLNAFSSSSQSYTHVVNQIDHNQKSINKRIENLFESENDLVDYYSKDSKILDADEIIKDWFPTIKADIFISHSHADEKLAIRFASWLFENFGLTAFIDSSVWGYSSDLLKKIDQKYCYKEQTKTYDYDKRNVTTSHVHMMLSTALNNMIDSTECLFFLNTPNSISLSNEITNEQKFTYSPWLYSELTTASIVEKKNPRLESNPQMSTEDVRSIIKHYSSQENLQIKYSLNLSELTYLRKADLKK
ncbi:TPA: hypothetical protein ACG8UZ_002949, partial [Enterococcus faecium]|nr:hypothetical protein [Enterococcus faecalis]HBL6673163.1 toll/interleukin-1 receptor domain-containing protein [Enterococcus faecium]